MGKKRRVMTSKKFASKHANHPARKKERTPTVELAEIPAIPPMIEEPLTIEKEIVLKEEATETIPPAPKAVQQSTETKRAPLKKKVAAPLPKKKTKKQKASPRNKVGSA
jgi:hypothetical protein